MKIEDIYLLEGKGAASPEQGDFTLTAGAWFPTGLFYFGASIRVRLFFRPKFHGYEF